MRRRDVGILALAAFSIFFSLNHEGPFSFRNAWHHPLPADEDIGGEAHLPPPLIADLNGALRPPRSPHAVIRARPAGDGRVEIVLATREATLQLLSPAPSAAADSDGGFTHAPARAEASLLPTGLWVSAGRRAIALAAGALDPPPTARSPSPRKQIVVVVTASWAVLAFDHNLRPLWEASLQADFPRHARAREAAVIVSNHTMRVGDRGVVIVCGSVDLGAIDGDADDDDDPYATEAAESAALAGHRGARRATSPADEDASGPRAPGAAPGVDASRHVSYFAFDGATGAPRWVHAAGDFQRGTDGGAALAPQHDYRLTAAAAAGRHFGEADCRDYRESMVTFALPHAWGGRDDTALKLAHFAKHTEATAKPAKRRRPVSRPVGTDHSSAVARAIARAAGALGATAAHRPGEVAPVGRRGRRRAAAARSHLSHAARSLPANAIVSHLSHGVEALHLYTGRTLCSLPLSPGALHGDSDGDNVIDHVTAVGWHDHAGEGGGGATKRCWATVTSGVPRTEHRFNGSLCRSVTRGRLHGANAGPASLELAPPAFLPRYHDGRGGAWRKRRAPPPADTVFLNSAGEMTSYSPDGDRRWQVATAAAWPPRAGVAAAAESAGPAAILAGKTFRRVVPTLAAFAPRSGGPPEAIVAAGESRAVFLSPGGTLLESLSLPAPPAAPLLIADLDGDGLSDVILVGHDGLFAFVQRTRVGALPLSGLLAALLAAMAAVYLNQMVLHAPRNGAKPLRSTD